MTRNEQRRLEMELGRRMVLKNRFDAELDPTIGELRRRFQYIKSFDLRFRPDDPDNADKWVVVVEVEGPGGTTLMEDKALGFPSEFLLTRLALVHG